MSALRIGAVEYLNARPLVHGLDRSRSFALRFDVPAKCADLLHEGGIDLGLIPSIEYLRGEGASGGYRIVPDVAIASRGPVASVALFTTRAIPDIRSIALDTSSRTSVALVRVLCAKVFDIDPVFEPHSPDLGGMLARTDAALIIGDRALIHERLGPSARAGQVLKVDLGEAWTGATGLPFVYAFWAGRPGAVTSEAVETLQRTRDEGVAASESIARGYFPDPDEAALGARYLRDNIKYDFGAEEREGVEAFYRYAAELGLAPRAPVRFY